MAEPLDRSLGRQAIARILGLDESHQSSKWMSKAKIKQYWTDDIVDLRTDELGRRSWPLFADDRFEFGVSTIVDRDDLTDKFYEDICVPDQETLEGEFIYQKAVLVGHSWRDEDKFLKEEASFDIHAPDIVTGILIRSSWRMSPGSSHPP
ncbi:hypothetical protein K469DRAFT_687246 [Zopfia rhizophila CBS 207.26]|uniref:Uncharacterized protein n=1 Tax=Zopfia rhizophila CBS 207.26 TaxID=1314779 RepID=A0A6A6E370_9PEZI|nr:hypothetical protein K469DRAFT_687246 [Zopfia rhizophila CBS 207.26]